MISAGGILAVGVIDYFTGIEIRIFPLYFLPLMFAARHLDKNKALGFALLTTVIWSLCNFLGGRTYSHYYIWVVNFITQGSAFIWMTLLYSRVAIALKRETQHSRTDALTGLSNTRSFYEQADSVLRLCRRNQRPLTLAYIDLDNFKNANDTRGHAFGDDVLRKVAGLLMKHFRTSDIVARMGGDEFAVVLPETTAADAEKVLEHFRIQLLDVPEVATCSVTASIGAVSYSTVPTDIELLIRSADALMYRVKKTGKNHVMVENL